MPFISKVKDIFQRGSSAKKKKSYHNVSLDNPEENWLIVGELGDGAYGKVFKAEHKIRGTNAALKQLELEGEEDLESFMIEIDILSECKHPNVVELLEAYHYDGKLWMYLEYCDGGALDSIIVDLDRPLTEAQIAYICKELCKALKYIHSEKVIHRDLKAGNVLLTMDGGVKLADFGVSAKNKNTLDKRGTFIGTPYWLAPEVILCETFIDANYDYKADIWSLGICLIEFAQMDPPHHEVSPVRVMLKIQKSDPPKLAYPSRWSKEFNDFIGKCLIKDPTHRPDTDELLKHPFINKELPLKPLRDLLLEYNAEVEEIFEEETDDHDNSRGSIVTELMTNIDNIDKDSTLKSNASKLTTPTEEVIPVLPNERKISKGPAPLPPKVNSNAQQQQPKKGPAPAAPSNPPTSISAPVSPTTPESQPVLDKSPSPSISSALVVSGSLPISLVSKSEGVPASNLKEEAPPIVHKKDETPSRSSQPGDLNITKDDSHIPENLPKDTIADKSSDALNAESPTKKTKLEADTQSDSSQLDALNITVNSVDVNISSDGPRIISLNPEQPEEDGQDKKLIPNENTTVSIPVKVDPNKGSEGAIDVPSSEPSDVLLTSISSEGTVIVRTPTPTLGSATEAHQSSSKQENVVICTDDESHLDAIGHRLDESEVVISNSSILQDTNENTSDFEAKQDVVEDVHDQKPISAHDASHISVVSIDESEKSDFNRQVSLTIEGTTVEATDVDDDIDSQNVSCQISANTSDSGIARDSPLQNISNEKQRHKSKENDKSPTDSEMMGPPLKPVSNGVQRQSSRCSDRSDLDTISTISSDKENRHRHDDSDFGEEVILRSNSLKKSRASPEVINKNDPKALKNKELQESIALRKKTRKRTRRFEIDGVIVTTTTSKVIYGDEDEDAIFTSAHLARKQELREIKILQKQEQKQFQELSAKAEIAKLEQERRFENEKINLTRNYDSQIENLNRQQKQQVEKAEVKQESELKFVSKKIRSEQERELKSFRESLKQELKLLKHEIDLLPKDKRKENFKFRKEKLEHNQSEREKTFLEKLNENHEMSLKRLNDEHRQHIALKERQFLEEKHQLMRARENALWEMEERHLHDRHQLAKEQLKDVYFLQRHQMLIRHNKELEQVRRMNLQKEEVLLKRQQVERRQLPKRIRQEMKTREKMFREKIRISMTTLPSQEDEKEQVRKFQELEKIKYDAERRRAEKKHEKQLEELRAASDYSIKELEILQNEKGKLLMEHETYKLKLLDEDYHKDLQEWKANLMPRKQKLEEAFEKQLSEQERFYGDYLNRGISATPSQSSSSLARATSS